MPHRRLRSASMTLAACALLAATGCAWRGGAKPSTPAARSAPSATLTPPEQALRDRVRELLAERMGEHAARIDVRVEGTNLWLTGRAPDRWERDRAHDLAHEVAGVTRVDSSGIGVD